MQNIKVMTIVGTRPELIRLSVIIKKLDKYTNHILVHTGQNYDFELNEIFFKELEIRKPDYFLNADKNSLGGAIADIIKNTEKLLLDESPDCVVILGDTNSSLSAIIAKRMAIPIYHLEAGNRSFDLNVPEEINRKIVDHISDFNLAYTRNSRDYLIREGYPHRQIMVVGSPMKEVLDIYKSRIDRSKVLDKIGLTKGEYIVLSCHRQENVDNTKKLKAMINMVNEVSIHYNKKVVFSVHPRTKNRIDDMSGDVFNDNVIAMKPFGFFDYIHLQKNAFCTLSDSGTISEESAILGFPAITIRESLERPEALDSGAISLTGFDLPQVISSIDFTTNEKAEIRKTVPNEYEIENTSSITVRLILGTCKIINKWNSIEK